MVNMKYTIGTEIKVKTGMGREVDIGIMMNIA